MDWKNEKEVPLTEVVKAFQQKHPDIDHLSHGKNKGLDGPTMRKIMAGDLVIVRIRGRRKYTIMDKEYIESGELDEHNARVREHNRAIRATNKAQRTQAHLEAMKDPAYRDLMDIFNRIKGFPKR